MAFDFDIECVKGNSIPHVDVQLRLRFYKESEDKTEEEFEDTFFIGWRLMFCLKIECLRKQDMIQY